MSWRAYCLSEKCKWQPREGLTWDEAVEARREHLRKKPKHDVRLKHE